MKMAGYEATPAEEMPRGDAPSGHTDNDTTADARKVTEPQLTRLHAIMNSKKLSRDTVKEYMKSVLDVETTPDLNREQYDQLCHWMEAQ